MMNDNQFGDLLAAHGGDPARWPAETRADALAFMRSFPEQAEALQAEAAALDAVLEAARIAAPSDALAAAILAAGQAETRFAPPWARLAAVLALSAGLSLGWGGASLDGASQGDAAYAVAFSSFAEADYEDVTEFLRDEAGR